MTCGCCNLEKPIVGVACVPFIPMSIAWCQECLNSGAIPYRLAVANTAACGGIGHCNPIWMQLVEITLAYFNITPDEFGADVLIELNNLEKYDGGIPS